MHEIKVWNESDLWELVKKLGSPTVVIIQEYKNWKEIYDYTFEQDIHKYNRRAHPPEWKVELIESIHITLVWDHLLAGYYHPSPHSKLNLRLKVPVQSNPLERNINRHLRPRDARGDWIDKDIWLYGREACYDEELLLEWRDAFQKKFKRRQRFHRSKTPIVKGKLKVPEPRYYEEY